MAKTQSPDKALAALARRVVACRRCPRLVEHRENVQRTKTRRFADQDYWGKALPAFGDPRARLLVVGLAPAAHGANRTGRMFTGDRSGDWLYEALHRFGFATQSESTSREDGLKLNDCCITAVARCAPPANKPTAHEIETCRSYMVRELDILEDVRVVLALGKIAFDGFLAAWRDSGLTIPKPKPKFGHASVATLQGRAREVVLVGSYHPSQQNTFTGRLTAPMFHQVFRKVRQTLDH